MTHSLKSKRAQRRTALGCTLTLAPLAVGLTACGSDGGNPLAGAPYDASDQIAVNAVSASAHGGTVDPGKPLKVTATGKEGRITDVTAVDTAGRFVGGKLSEDGKHWHSTTPLAAGVRYTVRISTENADGEQGRRTLDFQTKPKDARKLSVTFGPDSGTYGVAQPLTAELSHKITGEKQRKLVERALKVTSRPGVEGSWHWVDSKELHYRPRTYWPEHSSISVEARLKGLKIRDGLYGGTSKPLKLKTGDRYEAFVDAKADEMTVKKDGKTVKTIPVTTGKAGFETRTGTKVILGHQASVRMSSSTVNIGGGESYDLMVHWASRLTWSGEYLHAAPWSAGSHGVANTSHGCTGMGNANAQWVFENLHRGDPVSYTNTGGDPMPAFGNGFGDWNLSWKKWREGSALNSGSDGSSSAGNGQAQAARLRPQL